MNELVKKINACGLACPQPVLLTKKAIKEGGADVLEIRVDNPASRDNVARFINHAGHKILEISEKDGKFIIQASINQKAEASEVVSEDYSCSVDDKDVVAPTVLIVSDKMGKGDDELGALLMRSFIYTLNEADSFPARVILMNGGVKLAVEGSESLDNLQKLETAGVEIIACGTCLDFFKLKDKLKVGRITNMYEIANLSLSGKTLTIA